MNGLNESELKMLKKLRQMKNLSEARVIGIKWLNANKKRKHLRLLALRTVKGMHASDVK